VFADQINGPFQNEPVIVSFPYSAGAADADSDVAHNSNPTSHPLAVPAKLVGTTWGLGYNRFTRTVYAAAFMKKHTGFGPGGTGAIYQMETTGSTATLFADLNALVGAGTAGTDPHNPNNSLTDNFNGTWDAVGKTALGGLGPVARRQNPVRHEPGRPAAIRATHYRADQPGHRPAGVDPVQRPGGDRHQRRHTGRRPAAVRRAGLPGQALRRHGQQRREHPKPGRLEGLRLRSDR